MVEIKLVPPEKQGELHLNLNELETAASGRTFKDALINLVTALNADEIDTENNFLKIKF